MQIDKEKFEAFLLEKYTNQLKSISNSVELPSKCKQELSTYLSFLLHQKKFYANLSSILLCINPYPSELDENESYYSLEKFINDTNDYKLLS